MDQTICPPSESMKGGIFCINTTSHAHVFSKRKLFPHDILKPGQNTEYKKPRRVAAGRG